MNIISKLIRKFFSKKKETVKVDGKSIHEIIQETLNERTAILEKMKKKEIEPVEEIELDEQLVTMSEMPTKTPIVKKKSPKKPKK